MENSIHENGDTQPRTERSIDVDFWLMGAPITLLMLVWVIFGNHLLIPG